MRFGNGFFYKLDSLTALGGLNTKGMLLSYRPLKGVDKQRATDLGIKTIETDTFGTLTSQLQSWISSH